MMFLLEFKPSQTQLSEGQLRSRGVKDEVYSTATIANTLYELLFRE